MVEALQRMKQPTADETRRENDVKGMRVVLLAGTVAGLLIAGSVHAAPAADTTLAPISEGVWLGSMDTDCGDETGTTRDYECDFDGQAPSEYPPGSHCTETPAGPIVVSLECSASLSASTVGRLSKAGCLSTPPQSQLLTTNGSVTIFSASTQQSYNVPVKVWVTRGSGKFAGVGNYPLVVVKVSGSFTTDCGMLQSRGLFRGEFTIATAQRA